MRSRALKNFGAYVIKGLEVIGFSAGRLHIKASLALPLYAGLQVVVQQSVVPTLRTQVVLLRSDSFELSAMELEAVSHGLGPVKVHSTRVHQAFAQSITSAPVLAFLHINNGGSELVAQHMVLFGLRYAPLALRLDHSILLREQLQILPLQFLVPEQVVLSELLVAFLELLVFPLKVDVILL